MAQQIELTDGFKFQLIGGELAPFLGYISSVDPTMVSARALVQGSQNVIKKSSGTIAWREGLQLRGALDATIAGTKSSFEFNILGNIRPVRINNSKMQIEVDTTGSGDYTWNDLLTGLGDNTRFVFDSWWDDDNKKDVMLGVNGTGVLFAWSGGVGLVSSATATTIVLSGSDSVAELGFDSSGTVVVGGVEYVYTGAGVSENVIAAYTSTNNTPAISSSTWHSQSFTTGASCTQILYVTCKVKSLAVGTVNALFTGMIYSDSAGSPGTKVAGAQASIVHDYSTGDFTLTFTFNVTATPATVYHFVIRHDSGGSFDVYTGASGGVGTNTSTDSGATWSAQNGRLYCSMVENIVSEQTLIGVTPNPSALAAASVVMQKVTQVQNVPAVDFPSDFVRVVNNQVHVGSYSSRLVYISSNANYQDFTVPDVRAPGEADLLILDSSVRGIGSQRGNSQSQTAAISGSEGDWYSIVRSPITVGSTLTEDVQIVKAESADMQSALAHEFIGNMGDSLIFVDTGNQVRQYGVVRDIVTPVFPEVSLDVHDEFAATDFTGGHLRVIGDTIYLTAPLSGTTYQHVTRQKIDTNGNLTAERLWQPPQIVNVARYAVIDGVIYGHSTANPQLYQVFDTNQWHDDAPDGSALAYNCVARFAYRNAESIGSERSAQFSFDKEYVEGYIATGSSINGRVYYDYQGSTNKTDIVINSQDTPATFFTGDAASSLGDESLGDDPLGDGVSDDLTGQTQLPKFRVIVGISDNDAVFEYALEISSEEADARCELICLGVNAQLIDAQSVDIVQE